MNLTSNLLLSVLSGIWEVFIFCTNVENKHFEINHVKSMKTIQKEIKFCSGSLLERAQNARGPEALGQGGACDEVQHLPKVFRL